MGGNVCCEPRNYGGCTSPSTRNIIFLPKPVRTDYDQFFDQGRLLLAELEFLRTEFSESKKKMLELTDAEDSTVSFSIINAMKAFIWSISANKQGAISTLDVHLDMQRAPYLFVILDDNVDFPKDVYQFEKSQNSYFRVLFTYQSRIDEIITELQPLEIRLGAMIKCDHSDNNALKHPQSIDVDIVATAEDNLLLFKDSLKAAREFRGKIFSERLAFEANLDKLKDALQKARKIGSEAYAKKLVTPRDIADQYFSKKVQ